jgi:hypothetical protein
MAMDSKIKQNNDSINDFVKECGEFLMHLKKFKKQVKVIVPIKEQEVIHYKDFVDFLIKYEEMNVKKINQDAAPVNLLVGDSKIDLKEKLTQTVSIRN